MRFCKTFRSGGGLRISIPRSIQHALMLQPGDIVVLEHMAPGEVLMRNASKAFSSTKPQENKTCKSNT